MKQYLDHLQMILEKGTVKKPSREGMPSSISLFGYQARYNNVYADFPIITTKKVSWKAIVVELLWFLSGMTHIHFLLNQGVKIWNDDAYNYYKKVMAKRFVSKEILSKDDCLDYIKLNYWRRNFIGDCGMQYGRLWRDLLNDHNVEGNRPIDQIAQVIYSLKTSPDSRRHIVDSWNPQTLDQMALNACHCLFQFNCREIHNDDIVKNLYDGKKYILDLHFYQRSADMFLGVPFNISSYALLIHIMACIVDMVPGDLIHSFGDSHIYDNHFDQVNEQIKREPKMLPRLELTVDAKNLLKSIALGIDFVNWSEFEVVTELSKKIDGAFLFMLTSKDPHIHFFALDGYKHHPAIKGELSTGTGR